VTVLKKLTWKLALHFVLQAVALLYLFSRFVPWIPPGDYGPVDESWMQVAHLAFDEKWQFGRDIVFTFGPWGFLYGGYSPATHRVAVISWIVLALVFWFSLRHASRNLSSNKFFAWAWLMVFITIAGIRTTQYLDARLMAWVGLLLFSCFFVEDKRITFVQALLVATLGWLSLVRFNTLIATVPVLIAVSTHIVFRRRRFPWVLPLFIASVLFFWLAAGQRLGSLWPFLIYSLNVANGYTEAMMLSGGNQFASICWFLFFSAALLLLTGYVAWQRLRSTAVFFLVALCSLLFLIFKHGSVRFDDHEIAAVNSLLLISLLCVVVVWRENRRGLQVACVLITLGLAVFLDRSENRWQSDTPLEKHLRQTLLPQNLVKPFTTLFDSEDLQRDHKRREASYRSRFPLPLNGGEADIYTPNQVALLAHRIDYRPRPVIQSFSAYTPELAELNLLHLQTKPPQNILFGISPIDHRYPSLEDGLSWPELLARYDAKEQSGDILRLDRRATPRQYEMTLIKEILFGFGDTVNIPTSTNGAIWAEIEINRSVAGNLVTLLYKPTLLSMKATIDDETKSFRIIPAMARTRFLLSPFVDSAKSFTLLSSSNLTELSNAQVTSIKVYAETASGNTACYKSPMHLRLYDCKFSEPTP
jgi:hypothetical protein